MRVRITCNENSRQILIGIDPTDHCDSERTEATQLPKKISTIIRRIEATYRSPATPDKIEKRTQTLRQLRIECREPYKSALDLFARAAADENKTVREQARKGLWSQIDLGLLNAAFTAVERVTETGLTLRIGQHLSFPDEHLFENIPPARMSPESLPDIAVEGIMAQLELRKSQESELPPRLRTARKRTTKLHWQMAAELEQAINTEYAGRDLGTVANKMAVIETIRGQLRDHGMKVLCSRCKRTADLYVSSDRGAIRYRHTVDGRKQSHGAKVQLEELAIIPMSALNDHGEVVVRPRKARA